MRIDYGDIHLVDLQTRMPFRYGVATMTNTVQAFVRLCLEIHGRIYSGVAADLLPPKWFTKDAEKSLDAELAEMLRVIDRAVDASIGLRGDTAFDLWRQIDRSQHDWGESEDLPPLLTGFGTSLVERAVIEACCRATGQTFSQVLKSHSFGIRLGECDPALEGFEPAELLPARPLSRVTARHAIGLADPLTESEIPPGRRLDDGLPQSLSECVARYGLKQFKIKLHGDADQDADRLTDIAAVLAESTASEYAVSLDGNERFNSLDSFRKYWNRLTASPVLRLLLDRLMFVEQPFHRQVALDEHFLGDMNDWHKRPVLIIDESNDDVDSLSRALAFGYHGTSHKNCKGVFKSVLNACQLEILRRQNPHRTLLMSGEDLVNIGPVALLQDLAVAASLGIESIERNGHHYFAGLSPFPDSIQRSILNRHGDLYEPSPAGWPTLRIDDGELNLQSVNDAPFGVGFELDVTSFTPIDEWIACNLNHHNQWRKKHR